MNTVFGETNQKVKPLNYTGGTTDTAEVSVVGTQIFVNAHLSDSGTDSKIAQYVAANLNKADSEVQKQFVTAVSETDGVIDVTRRGLTVNDLPTIPTSKVSGLTSSLTSITNSVAVKQNQLSFTDVTSAKNPVATKNYVDEAIESSSNFLGISQVDPMDTTRSTYPDIITSEGTFTPNTRDFCFYSGNDGAMYAYNGSEWYIVRDLIVHKQSGDITNSDITSNANIDQYKINGLRNVNGTGYLDRIDVLIADKDTAGSVANKISLAINALNKTDTAGAHTFVTAVSESAGVISVTRRAIEIEDLPPITESTVVGLSGDLATINSSIASLSAGLSSETTARIQADALEASTRASELSALSLNELEFAIGDGRTSGSTAPGEVIWKISQTAGKIQVSKTTLTEDDIPSIPYEKLYNYSELAANWKETDTTAVDYIKNKPTKLSDFTNDQNFITNIVSDLVNYYTKAEAYTKAEVDALVSAVPKFEIAVVDELPPLEDASTTTIYMLRETDPSGAIKTTEYVCTEVGGVRSWQTLGSRDIDLSNYLKVTDIADWAKADVKPTYTAAEVGAMPDSVEIPTALSQLTTDATHRVVTNGQIASWDAKQDTIPDLNTIRSSASSAVQPEQLATMTPVTTAAGVTYIESDPTVPAWAKETVPSFSATTLADIDTLSVACADVANSVDDSFFDATHRLVTDAQIAAWNSKSGIGKYADLPDKPLINNVEVSGNKSLDDYGIINNVQADWNAAPGSPAAILNKPNALGAIDDVLVNGASVVSNKVASIVVPTALSALTSDSTHRLVSDVNKTAWNNKFDLPENGVAGDILVSNGIGDAEWKSAAEVTPVKDIQVNGTTIISAAGVANIIFDSDVSSASSNAVMSSGIYDKIIDTDVMPTKISIGGIEAGTDLSGKTAVEILDNMLKADAAPSVAPKERYDITLGVNNVIEFSLNLGSYSSVYCDLVRDNTSLIGKTVTTAGNTTFTFGADASSGTMYIKLYTDNTKSLELASHELNVTYIIPVLVYAGNLLPSLSISNFKYSKGNSKLLKCDYMVNNVVYVLIPDSSSMKPIQGLSDSVDSGFNIDTTTASPVIVTGTTGLQMTYKVYMTEKFGSAGSAYYGAS